MHDTIEAIIHKAPVQDLAIHVGKSGLCLGDRADLRLMPDGSVGVYCMARRRTLLFTQRAERRIGHLGPQASAIVMPALEQGEALRVRIVGLTPEHLAQDGHADVHISVWGQARRFAASPHAEAPDLFPPQDEEPPPET